MSTLHEIQELENQMVKAELAPDPDFFARVLADEALLDGKKAKAKVVSAHQPGHGPKFTRVEMRDLQIIPHGPTAAVVTCTGTYEGPQWSGTLRFMRVWLKTAQGWKIIAGTTAHEETGGEPEN